MIDVFVVENGYTLEIGACRTTDIDNCVIPTSLAHTTHVVYRTAKSAVNHLDCIRLSRCHPPTVKSRRRLRDSKIGMLPLLSTLVHFLVVVPIVPFNANH